MFGVGENHWMFEFNFFPKNHLNSLLSWKVKRHLVNRAEWEDKHQLFGREIVSTWFAWVCLYLFVSVLVVADSRHDMCCRSAWMVNGYSRPPPGKKMTPPLPAAAHSAPEKDHYLAMTTSLHETTLKKMRFGCTSDQNIFWFTCFANII